jgi:hypothetical protein
MTCWSARKADCAASSRFGRFGFFVGISGVSHVSNWREHVRIVALIVNVLLVLFLLGSRGWFMSMGFGVPMIVAPLLAIAALITRRR